MWALIAGVALAQSSWTVTPVFVGTDVSGSTGDVAVGIALAGWSDTGGLYFALERETPSGLSRTHRLYLVSESCPGGWGVPCDPMMFTEVGLPQDDKMNLTSITLEPGPVAGGEPLVHLIRGLRDDTCGTPTRVSEEQIFDPTTGLLTPNPVLTDAACGDLQLSHTVLDGSTAYTCVTNDPTTAGQDNVIWCGTRALGGTSPWSMSLFASGTLTQDHPWFVVQGGVQTTVFRDRSPDPDVISLDVSGARIGDLPDGGPFQQNDFPSIAAAPDGSLHAVWVESHLRLSYAKCEVGLDCADLTNWVLQPRAVRMGQDGTVDHPEIAIAENGRMFVLYSEDVDPTSGDQRRVFVKEKCRSTLLFSGPAVDGELVYDIGASSDDQTLLVGRPHLWVDDTTSTVHLVFLEKDFPGADPVHGDAYWAWKTFDPCP